MREPGWERRSKRHVNSPGTSEPNLLLRLGRKREEQEAKPAKKIARKRA